jgi:hypothetical protein
VVLFIYRKWQLQLAGSIATVGETRQSLSRGRRPLGVDPRTFINIAMADPLRELKSFGRDVAGIPLARLPKSFKNVAFLCVNTYTSYRLNMGTGPITDALSFAECIKPLGF